MKANRDRDRRLDSASFKFDNLRTFFETYNNEMMVVIIWVNKNFSKGKTKSY